MANLNNLIGVADIRKYKNFVEYPNAGTFTFTVPAGITRVRATVVGAGGGGGISNTQNSAQSGDGGNGGGFAMGEYTVTPGQSITVTVGAAGNRTTSFGTYGGDGGTSSFGAFCSATGGGGGGYANGSGKNTSAGSGSGGTLVNSSGGSRGYGQTNNSTGDTWYSGGGGGGGSAGSWRGTGGRGGQCQSSNSRTQGAGGGGGIGGQGGDVNHGQWGTTTTSYDMGGGGGGGSIEAGGGCYPDSNSWGTNSGFGGAGYLAPRNMSPHSRNSYGGASQTWYGLNGHHGALHGYAEALFSGADINTNNTYRFATLGVSQYNFLMTADTFVAPRLFCTVGSGGTGAFVTNWNTSNFTIGGNGAAGGGGGGAVKNGSSGYGNGGNGGFLGGGGGSANQNGVAGNGGNGGGGGGAGNTLSWTSTTSGFGGAGYVAVEW